MEHTIYPPKVNSRRTGNEQPQDLVSWEQLGIPLARVLTDIAARVSRENAGKK
jgi:hypothetical protein